MRRRSGFNAWRDTLVVAVAALDAAGRNASTEVLTSTLVLAERQRIPELVALTGLRQRQNHPDRSLLWATGRHHWQLNCQRYEALRQRRGQLIPRQGEASDLTITDDTLSRLSRQRWHQLQWSRRDDGTQSLDSLCLRANGLVAITGPSGSGKTTLLEICGLLNEEDSHWQLRDDTWSTERAGRGAADASADCLCPSERGAV